MSCQCKSNTVFYLYRSGLTETPSDLCQHVYIHAAEIASLKSNTKLTSWWGRAELIWGRYPHCTDLNYRSQGRRHNGNQAARPPRKLCSFCANSFVALAKAVRLFIASLHSLPMCYQMCAIDIVVISNQLAEIWKGDFRLPSHLTRFGFPK